MRAAIVHLSDIHFRTKGNPVLGYVDQLAHAINSADGSISLFLIIISGDIAFSGKTSEYEIALSFLRDLSKALKALRPRVKIEFVSVPGNHDCVLPESGVRLRDIVIQGAIQSMQEKEQDQNVLKQLLKAQAPYTRFRNRLRKGKWNGLCETVLIEHEGKTIQLNLYNTALLSQRRERQGQLYIPVNTFEENISLRIPSALCISVFHHSFFWLESNVAIAFRAYIENTSDIALSGHQHYSHGYAKENLSGERVLYIEAPALQDESYAKSSGFRVLLFDWETEKEKLIAFRRSRDSYRRTDDGEWKDLTLNRALRPAFRFSRAFDDALNQHGIPLSHGVKGTLKLRDIFVFPNLIVKRAGVRMHSDSREIKGDDIIEYVRNVKRVLFQGPAFGGKTALARVLVWEILRRGIGVPLFMSGAQIESADESKVLQTFWNTFSAEYDSTPLEQFRQLASSERVLMIDDWHNAHLNPDGRSAFLNLAGQYFDRVLLFTDELFQIHQLLDKSTDIMLDFHRATILDFGHTQRGALIDRWVTLGSEHTGDPRDVSRTIEEKERLIQDMIGKNTLPSLPFIVLSLLEADEVDKAEAVEAGSFGYLYDVLVTVALSATKGPKPQLEKKYVFLATLAYRMFKLKTKTLPLSSVRGIAQEHFRSNYVKIDVDSMLTDLEAARVFVNIDGNCRFAYSHLFYYFIARYYRDALDRDSALMSEIIAMIDDLSSNESASILTFIVFFARHSREIVEKLVANANLIYPSTSPATLENDITFLNRLEEPPILSIPPDDINIPKLRAERREFRDRLAKNVQSTSKPDAEHDGYSESLSDKDKFDIAYRHVDLLGQIIRNFPASLPGADKLKILECTYQLGLRLLSELLRMLQSAVEQFRDRVREMGIQAETDWDEKKVRSLADTLIILMGRLCTLVTIKRVSLSVGVADLAEAYKEAMKLVGKSNATELIDLSIKLDHFVEFPEYEIRALHKKLSNNPFADSILSDLVTAYMMMFELDRGTRQSMSALFKLNPRAASFIDSKNKKLSN